MTVNNQAIVHFSGGTDSTLAAALYLRKGFHVHLITYDRMGFVGSIEHTKENFDRLTSIYGDKKITRKIVNIESLHKFICYKNYLQLVRQFKFTATALCFSKLAMHLFSCAYAKKFKIAIVADGAVPYMKMYPDQNKEISINPLNTFYSSFNVRYENPVFDLANKAEDLVYDMGVTPYKKTRGTEKDKQVYYIEQVFLAFFLKYYGVNKSYKKYELDMKQLYLNRIKLMENEIHKYIDNSDKNSVFLAEGDLKCHLQ